MTDEGSKRRARTHSDDRDRRRTPRDGVPVATAFPVEIDPDKTPPPQEPPKPETIAGFSTIPEPIKDQLKQLSASVVDLTQAQQRTWDNRHNSTRIDRLEQSVNGGLQDNAAIGALLHDFVMPGLKASMARIDVLLTHHENSKVRQEVFYERDWPTFTKNFDLLVDRIGRIERTQDRQESDMRAQGERFATNNGVVLTRVNAMEQVSNAHAVQLMSFGTRITSLERVNEDAKLANDVTNKAERKRAGYISAVVSALVVGIGALISAFK